MVSKIRPDIVYGRYLEKGIHPLSNKQARFSFEFEGRIFSKPRLLNKNFGRTLSKAGRLSWFALMDGQPVKIYQCYSESHAEFIARISKHPRLRIHFPTCLMRIGAFLVVQWIEGEPVTWRRTMRDGSLLKDIAKMQALFHKQSAGAQEESGGFDYMEYLKNRLHRFKSILPLDDAIQRIYMILDDSVPITDKHISHPDLTADNLIVEAGTGVLKIIDNELLTQNQYCLIDLFNTHRSFGRRLKHALLEPYLVHYTDSEGDLAPLVENEDFYSALWYLRLIGSSLQAGALGTAFQLAQQYIEGGRKSHQLVQLVKERFV